jgi:hypothetical protein
MGEAAGVGRGEVGLERGDGGHGPDENGARAGASNAEGKSNGNRAKEFR